MELTLFRSLSVFLLFAVNSNADDIELEVESGVMLKMLREMAQKTNASDSLNLPANASSIRENITDTFSCENRTYGYYADVDNECQLFHVCLPSQTPSGRNVTYRWSFICPNETIFNQEVLTCTRPIDAIECKDSPSYYDLNLEIGKVPPKNDTKTEQPKTDIRSDVKTIFQKRPEEVVDTRHTFQSRRPDAKPSRKQNIIMETLFKEIVDEEFKGKLEDVDFGDKSPENIFPEIISDIAEENARDDNENKDDVSMTDEIEGRLALERSMGEQRGGFRFRADV